MLVAGRFVDEVRKYFEQKSTNDALYMTEKRLKAIRQQLINESSIKE